ncbi:hypothetical protein DFH27DRAFT_521477 [Peziza echinospora]|nr:hypothetical protein DFH27DRAFT_521477 [Peziza echinospora]
MPLLKVIDIGNQKSSAVEAVDYAIPPNYVSNYAIVRNANLSYGNPASSNTAYVLQNSPFSPGFPFDTLGPVIPEGPLPPYENIPPYENTSSDFKQPINKGSFPGKPEVEDALAIISENKLAGWCRDLVIDSRSLSKASTQATQRRDPESNSNVNVSLNDNYNGDDGSSSSYSSSYTNSNGHVTGYVSENPGPGGKPYYTQFDNLQSEGEESYAINGWPVPKALWGKQPGAIQAACSHISKTETAGDTDPQSTSGGVSEQPKIPKYEFENVYYGSGSDLPLLRYERPGLPDVPYALGQFTPYRQQCGTVCERSKDCSGFVVSTDYTINKCMLVTGKSIGRNDFLDESQGADGDGRHYLTESKVPVEEAKISCREQAAAENSE